jgi:hypothetical protein
MGKVTVEVVAPDDPKDPVLLHGEVRGVSDDTVLDVRDYVVVPYVWQFGATHGSSGHGWRPAGEWLYYDIKETGPRSGVWTAQCPSPGAQYAVVCMKRADAGGQRDFRQQPADTEVACQDGPGWGAGTLLQRGLAVPPGFSVPSAQVVIKTTPADHLTGAVLGVSRGAPEGVLEDEYDTRKHPRSVPHFRMLAWAEKKGATFFIGEVKCHLNCFWTFHKIKDSLRNAERFHVALAPANYDPASPLPQEGDVTHIAWKEHNPLMTRGA